MSAPVVISVPAVGQSHLSPSPGDCIARTLKDITPACPASAAACELLQALWKEMGGTYSDKPFFVDTRIGILDGSHSGIFFLHAFVRSKNHP